MKKVFALMLCGLCLSLAGCGGGKSASAEAPGAQLANPFVDYATREEAGAAAGFALSAPDWLDGYDAPTVQVMNGTMLQLIFRSGDDRLVIRKAAGGEDISGDYNSYAETKTAKINGSSVTLRGADGKVSSAVWCAGGYSYAVVSDTPLPSDVMTDLIAEIS